MTASKIVKTIHTDEFNELIHQGRLFFVDFWAKWCAPCRQFAPIYERIAQQYPDILFTAIDIEQETQLAEELNIRSIPHLMVFKSGVAIYSDSGSMPESVLHELADQSIKVDMSGILKEE